MKCKFCKKSNCIKKGVRNAIQKYYCKECHKYFQIKYSNKLCNEKDLEIILRLTVEGVGVSSIARLLKMSKSNVIYKLKEINETIVKPVFFEEKQSYEVDEMYTYVKNKSNGCYITYALNRKTKQVINMIVGSRTKENIGLVIQSIIELKPRKIYTDKLNVYPSLIDKSIHSTRFHKTNKIERFNLTLRTHLKRLTRKTICFSKSREMLECCLRIYFWSKKENVSINM